MDITRLDGGQRKNLTNGQYSLILGGFLLLFCLRVMGQLLVAFGGVSFLPPMSEWMSGAMSYPALLTSQFLIVLLFGKICFDLSQGRGFTAKARPWLARFLTDFGLLYLLVMTLRYVIHVGLYPHERWFGGCIPIAFHLVLAAFILTYAAYQRDAVRMLDHGTRALSQNRFGVFSELLIIVVGLLFWIAYQVAPSVIAMQLGFRPAQYAVKEETDATLTTSDGIVLVADIYRPQHIEKTPTILIRIPFSASFRNCLTVNIIARLWAERGYTVLIQGTRGRFKSGGAFYPLKNERQDGLETLAWIKSKPWFDGRILTWGGSAFGYTQWAVSDQVDPGPNAMNIYFCSTDIYRMFHPGGAFALHSALSWAINSHGLQDLPEWPSAETVAKAAAGLPLIDADKRAVNASIPFFRDWFMHKDRDQYWTEIDGTNKIANLKMPVLLIAGWYDPFLPGQLDDFTRIRSASLPVVRNGSRLIIGTWGHACEVKFPSGQNSQNFRLTSLEYSLPWFDQNLNLRSGRQASFPPVKLFVMGANKWRDENEWPLARTEYTPFFLQSQGHANGNFTGKKDSVAGGGRLTSTLPAVAQPEDSFVYDPRSPVPTLGGAMIGKGAGIALQNALESRSDLLIYDSLALPENTEITGPVTLILYATSTAPCTDFTAKLIDLYPDGRAYNVTDGIVRHRFKSPVGAANKTSQEKLPEALRIDLCPTSMFLLRGHRLRLELSSSNFPRFDCNPNTGYDSATERQPVKARQVIEHNRIYPTRLILPIIPGGNK